MNEHVTAAPREATVVHAGNAGERNSYFCLDVARWLAAMAVAGGHLRSLVFVDANSAGNADVPWKLFYYLTGLGHEAVMVFFVMSGFLIGKHVYDTVAAGQWAWANYAITRLSRLWIVLIPALTLNALWDYIGIHLSHGSLYAGLLNDINHSTPGTHNVALIYGFDTFLANVLFLQTIVAPTFGTNTPLWSLANEFWYYVIFPLGFLASRKTVPALQRIAFASLAIAICFVLPTGIVLSGMIWMFGFGVFLVHEHTTASFSISALRIYTGLSAALFLAAIAGAKLLPANHLGDFICGGAFALLLYFLTRIQGCGGIVRRLSKTLAGFSYTLYLTHFPLLALLSSTILRDTRFQPGVGPLALYLMLLVAMTGYAYLIYILFERNTGHVQTFLLRRLARWRQQRIANPRTQGTFMPAPTLGSH
jgi:peptidoglycan/LPS O-acetylase OafA/YrhL